MQNDERAEERLAIVNIEKQVAYWQKGAEEDWAVARHLLDRGNTRHGLFFIHLALEKALKALICRHTQDLAPKDHNLVRLAEKAGLSPSRKQLDVLAETTAFNVEGRYPDPNAPLPTRTEIRHAVARAEEVFRWLIGLS